jgi:hypothetical protein
MSQPSKTGAQKFSLGAGSEFLTNGFLRFRYSGFSLIRSDLAVAAAGEAESLCVCHRVPDGSRTFADFPARVG